MARVRVIGCGNPDAGDDAAGLIAVGRAAPALTRLGVEVVEAGAALKVLDLMEGADALVVVDAVRDPSGRRQPGTLVRAEAGPDGLPTDLRSSLSSHGLGLAEAIGLAAALGPVPRVVFHGVEVADVTAGRRLSVPVAEALSQLVQNLLDEVAQLLGRS